MKNKDKIKISSVHGAILFEAKGMMELLSAVDIVSCLDEETLLNILLLKLNKESKECDVIIEKVNNNLKRLRG